MARFMTALLPCEWLYEALLVNGIPREKLVLCRYGFLILPKAAPKLKQQTRPLRVGFLGRWSTDKGIHILVEALRCLPPDVPIELWIHAVGDNEPYRKQISEYRK